jgi:hypothetical protein
MKRRTLFFYLTFLSNVIFAQDLFPSAFSEIKNDLVSWDPIRGEWLATSILAMNDNATIPDRTFPEEYTPYEMLTMIPLQKRKEIAEKVARQQSTQNTQFSREWNFVNLFFNHSFCEPSIGRSYGDPHLNSFDNASYSFQTVGEFVLSKSKVIPFEVQVRQLPQDQSFSLNSAVSMNVGGDRLSFYTAEKPDNQKQAFRLNGVGTQLSGRTYFLPKGGTIRLEGRNYIVSWPTGESVIIDNRASRAMTFVNITVQVFKCDQNQYEGLLGNLNGDHNDDFNGRDNKRQTPVFTSSYGNLGFQQASVIAEKEYLNFLARDFADDWRVNDQTTLFDYSFGESTTSFTDRSFPYVHYTLNDIPLDRQNSARRRCEEMGISQAEMNGCIYDQGFLNIAPNPIPNPSRPSSGGTLQKLNYPALNTNQGLIMNEINKGDGTTKPLTIEKPQEIEREINQNERGNQEEIIKVPNIITIPKPVRTEPSKPVSPSKPIQNTTPIKKDIKGKG